MELYVLDQDKNSLSQNQGSLRSIQGGQSGSVTATSSNVRRKPLL